MDLVDAVKLGKTLALGAYDEEVALLKTLAQIPAPTGSEDQRAAFIAQWFRNAGARHVEIDAAKNVLCWVRDTPGVPVEVFSAHTDVVFDDTTPLPLREEGGRLYAPGVGDDTANLVGLMMATRCLLEHRELTLGRSILVVANSCEEGLGNLRGTREVYRRMGDRVACHVAFDLYFGGCTYEPVGSHRWRVSCKTAGGHFFGDYGNPNAIAEHAELVVELSHTPLPSLGVCTQNVGTVSGGTTVNSIATQCEMLYEYRSTSEEALGLMRASFESAVERHGREGVRFDVELVGERPGCGVVDEAALEALVARSTKALGLLGVAEPRIAPASTDANIPLSLGVPAICVGAVRGADLHTRGEWIETESLLDGFAFIIAMMLAS